MTTPETPLLHFFNSLGLIRPALNPTFGWAESAEPDMTVKYDPSPSSLNWGPKPIWRTGVCDCETEAQVVARLAQLAAPISEWPKDHDARGLIVLVNSTDDIPGRILKTDASIKAIAQEHVILVEIPSIDIPLAVDVRFVSLRECGGRYGVRNILGHIYLPSEELMNEILAFHIE